MEEIVSVELGVVITSVPMPKGVALTIYLILPQHRRRTGLSGGTYVTTIQSPITSSPCINTR